VNYRYALIFFLLFSRLSLAQTVTSIQFEGLTHTKEDYLRRIIHTKEGNLFDSLLIDKDVLMLKNLNLFFDVSADCKTSIDSNMSITFYLKEAHYFYPIFSVSGFKGQIKLNIGFNHINFLGRAQNFGVMYQYYERHSFSIFHSQKRHSNRKTGHEASLSKYSTIEPLYQNDTLSRFNFDNYSLSLGGFYWLGQFLRVGIGSQAMYEKYEQLDTAFYLPKKTFYFRKYQLRTSLEYNDVQYSYEFQQGYFAKIFGEYIGTENYPDASFFKLTAQLSSYLRFGERGNLALNSRFGIATNNESPFSPFVIDGLINVRGAGNRVERGTAEWVVNAEYRHSVWVNKFFSLQPAIFIDFATLRKSGKSISTFFNEKNQYVYTGAGIRVNLRKWYHTSLRLDYSVNVTNSASHGFTFGIGQFF